MNRSPPACHWKIWLLSASPSGVRPRPAAAHCSASRLAASSCGPPYLPSKIPRRLAFGQLTSHNLPSILRTIKIPPLLDLIAQRRIRDNHLLNRISGRVLGLSDHPLRWRHGLLLLNHNYLSATLRNIYHGVSNATRPWPHAARTTSKPAVFSRPASILSGMSL
jgi:hypothetical protein